MVYDKIKHLPKETQIEMIEDLDTHAWLGGENLQGGVFAHQKYQTISCSQCSQYFHHYYDLDKSYHDSILHFKVSLNCNGGNEKERLEKYKQFEKELEELDETEQKMNICVDDNDDMNENDLEESINKNKKRKFSSSSSSSSEEPCRRLPSREELLKEQEVHERTVYEKMIDLMHKQKNFVDHNQFQIFIGVDPKSFDFPLYINYFKSKFFKEDKSNWEVCFHGSKIKIPSFDLSISFAYWEDERAIDLPFELCFKKV
jgi:hypothetical protein